MNRGTRQQARRLTDIGFLHFEAERWKDAETSFRSAALQDPDDEDAWLGLGSALRQQARNQEAAIVFGIAAAIARSSGAWATLLAAESLLEAGARGKAREAMAWFDKLVEREGVTEEQLELARALQKRTEEFT